MSEALTVQLPPTVKRAVDDAAREEGVSADDLVERAVQAYLFSRKLKLLRDRLVPQAQAQGVITDDDVFRQVS